MPSYNHTRGDSALTPCPSCALEHLEQVDQALAELDELAKQVAAGMVREALASSMAAKVVCRFGVLPVNGMINWYQQSLAHERESYARAIATYQPSGHYQR